MDFDAEDVEELDAALVGVSWSDIHLLKCNPSEERRVSTNPSGRAAMGMKRTAITPFPVRRGPLVDIGPPAEAAAALSAHHRRQT